MSAIVVYGCQGLLHDILNGFHFSRDLELMRKQLYFFSLRPCTRSWFYLYNMSCLVLWYSWPRSTRLLRILTESNSTSNPVMVSGCVISGARNFIRLCYGSRIKILLFLPLLGLCPILTQIYGPIIFFQSRPGADPDFLKRGGKYM